MAQFVMGFWCGFIVAALLLSFLYLYLKRKNEKTTATKDATEAQKKEESVGYEMSFLAPQVKLLIVDDSKLSRTVIKEFFRKTGIQISEAENGAECIKLVQKDAFDLIFLDQRMPGMDGTETIQRLWTEGGVGKKVPIIAMSSVIRRENEAEFLAKGYAGCIGKPIQGNRLEEIVLQVLPTDKIVQKPEGFSYQNGLANFDGNESVYRETLGLFAELWEERKVQLQQFLEEGNMEEYAILIHAIKGDARTMGADILAKLAYEQEIKAKAGQVESIQESFERVIKVGDKTAVYFKQMFTK